MSKVKELIAQLDAAEDALSEAGMNLQRVREQIVAAYSPVQMWEETEVIVDGHKTKIKVSQVQVARQGRHGHIIAVRGNLIKDGVETTELVEATYPIPGV